MKKLLLLTVLLFSSGLFAQATQKLSYQAIVRNSDNELVQNGAIGIKISILSEGANGTPIYVETHTAQTNENGLFNIQIGGGAAQSGAYTNAIFWGQGNYFVKTELDPTGGVNYTISSTTELLSVPYANYAHVSGTLAGFSADFIGAYVQTNQATTDAELLGHSFITYLGFDKVMWTINSELEFGEESILTSTSLYGTVLGNQVTFDGSVFGVGTMTGIKEGNTITISYGTEGDVIIMEKE